MKIIHEPFGGIKLIEIDRYDDERGQFSEVWNEERYRPLGLEVRFVQTNVSDSHGGVLRGMHFQAPVGQGKLVTVLAGSVFDAVVDVRAGSAFLGQWYGCELSAANRRQLWVPRGFAHGFLTTSDRALVHYSCTHFYDRHAEQSLIWNDPAVGIAWPLVPTIISAKDDAARRLHELQADGLLVEAHR